MLDLTNVSPLLTFTKCSIALVGYNKQQGQAKLSSKASDPFQKQLLLQTISLTDATIPWATGTAALVSCPVRLKPAPTVVPTASCSSCKGKCIYVQQGVAPLLSQE